MVINPLESKNHDDRPFVHEKEFKLWLEQRLNKTKLYDKVSIMYKPEHPRQIITRSPQDSNVEYLSRHRGRGTRKLMKHVQRLPHSSHGFVEDLLLSTSTSIDLRERWFRLSHQEKSYYWYKALCTAIRFYPHSTMKFLVATCVAPFPPSDDVSDILEYIVWLHLKDATPGDIDSESSSVLLYRSIMTILQNVPPGHTTLSQLSIWLLLRNLPSSDVAGLFRRLDTLNNNLSQDTLAHFVYVLAKAGPEFEELAFEIFQRIADSGHDLNATQIRNIGITILANSTNDGKSGHSEKFEYMLKRGLNPDIITYNVLLMKNLQAGDHVGSWRIYEMMKEDGPIPDMYTYSILLNDAKRRRDLLAISRVMKAVNGTGENCEHVIADVLHSIFLFVGQNIREEENQSQSGKIRSRFEELLPYYSKHYKFGPLAHLLPGLAVKYPDLLQLDAQPPKGSRNFKLLDPPPPAVVIMLTSLFVDYQDPNTAKWFYEHWRDLVHADDPFILQCLNHPSQDRFLILIYNLILKNLGRHVENIPLCLQILGEMSKPRGAAKGPVSTVLIPKPNEYTWTILLKMFMDHRQPRAAEKVLGMMNERGIKPTRVTYNILVQGYARMEDTRMVVDALDRHARAGFNIDHTTFDPFRAGDRTMLVDGMRRTELERMADQVREKDREDANSTGASEGEFAVGDFHPSVSQSALEDNTIATETSSDEFGYGDLQEKTSQAKNFDNIESGNAESEGDYLEDDPDAERI
ncbi:hypothetical protein BJ875DRAFT_16240 [Amylocarpus encephaloides]|uniref:Pentacotripeptide-repeat region of PRORP domain-containing protein n=1 Tax=Amylocarpus encephaloides TaxID=45428 RepID=A0A9P7YJS9_9HELO|nr:hypothetical protein BJ875DRAFT_16240 [Amylocarpus encephaloides]